jgi:O-antigen/teichoic acid export membrane protein
VNKHYSAQALRRGVGHFLVGKAASAGLNFCGFLLVARLLPTAEYGRYVTLIALVELGLNLASFGLDWVSARYVPEYRVHAGGRALARFVRLLCALQSGLLAALALLLACAAQPLTALLGMGAATAAVQLYAAYLFLEGLSRVVRDQMLGQLLLQGRAQLALVLRHLAWVLAAGVLWWVDGAASLHQVAVIEIGAAALGLVAGWAGLSLALRAAAREPAAPTPGWQAPQRGPMQRLAWSSYVSLLLNIPARPQVLLLLVTRLAGVEAAALYGFARNLADQVLRFLPAELLLGFVRPALVARYVAGRDIAALNRHTNVLLAVSLLVLGPVLALVLGQGALVVQVLGGGRFDGSAVLLALMLLAVALFSHRRVLEFVANTVERPEVIVRASLLMLLVPVAGAALLHAGLPVWTLPAVALAAEALFGGVVMRRLRAVGMPYVPPWQSLCRVAVLVALAAGAAAWVPRLWGAAGGLGALLACLALVLLTFAACTAIIRPLDAQALASLKSLRKQEKAP